MRPPGIGFHVTLAIIIQIAMGAHAFSLSQKIDALQSTADQTVDFLSDLHAERAKP